MKSWPLYAAIALTVLFATFSTGLMFYPVETVAPENAQVVVTQAPEKEAWPAPTVDVTARASDSFAWGLGTGIALTLVFVLSPFPRLRHK